MVGFLRSSNSWPNIKGRVLLVVLGTSSFGKARALLDGKLRTARPVPSRWWALVVPDRIFRSTLDGTNIYTGQLATPVFIPPKRWPFDLPSGQQITPSLLVRDAGPEGASGITERALITLAATLGRGRFRVLVPGAWADRSGSSDKFHERMSRP